jgi:uncharacterized Tic20 family protein
METTSNKNTATLIHLGALTQYFIPLGNFIFPVVLWSSFKKNGPFVDHHGRQAINFQLSLFLYTLILAFIAIPAIMYSVVADLPRSVEINDDNIFIREFPAGNLADTAVIAVIAVILFAAMKAAEFALVVYAAVKATHGEWYNYPFTINFIKGDMPEQVHLETQNEAPIEQ